MRIATRYLVRTMTLDDIPQVMEVERDSFPTMWPPTAFKRELQQNSLARYIVVVEHRPDITTATIDGPAVAAGSGGALERLFGEIRRFLSADESPTLAPLEQRPELVVGLIGLWLLPDEAHIVTFGVRRSHRRGGIGELLLISAIDLAQANTETVVTLECRVSNEPALALYEKYAFEKVGLRPRYYSDDHEDAYVLTTADVTTRKYRESFDELKSAHRRRWGDFETEAIL